MIDVQEMLRMKENELALVRKEVDALRTAAPLLTEPGDPDGLQTHGDLGMAEDSIFKPKQNASVGEPSDSEDESVLGSIGPKRSRIRDWIGRAVGE